MDFGEVLRIQLKLDTVTGGPPEDDGHCIVVPTLRFCEITSEDLSNGEILIHHSLEMVVESRAR